MAKAKTQRKGREAGPVTVAVRELLDKHGDLSYKVALPYIEKMPKPIRDKLTENTPTEKHPEGANQGANNFNVIKNGWKHLNGFKTTKAKKATAAKPKKAVAKTSKVVVTKRTRRPNQNVGIAVLREVAQFGGVPGVKKEIARLTDEAVRIANQIARLGEIVETARTFLGVDTKVA